MYYDDTEPVFMHEAPTALHPTKARVVEGLASIVCEMKERLNLSDFSTVVGVPGNGHCAYRSLARGLSSRLSAELETDSVLQNELHPSSSGSVYFRYQLYDFISNNQHRLLNTKDPIFLDEYGQPDPIFKILFDGHGNEVCTGTDALGRAATTMELLLARIYR